MSAKDMLGLGIGAAMALGTMKITSDMALGLSKPRRRKRRK